MEGIQEENPGELNITLYIAAGISYDHKGPLQFYHDPADPVDKRTVSNKPSRPRRGKYESETEYQKRLEEWRVKPRH